MHLDLERISRACHDPVADYCAIAAAVNVPNAAQMVRDMLMVMQHRGEKSTGIISAHDGRFFVRKNLGRVLENFPLDYDFKHHLPGRIATGHNRYATCGNSDSESNIQPFFFNRTRYGPWTFAHNGQLILNGITSQLTRDGAMFQSSTDSEVMAHLFGCAPASAATLEEAIISQAPRIPAAYSCVIMAPDRVIAFRDSYKVRPLSIAKFGEGYLIASETCAFNIFKDAKFLRDVEPGELVTIKKNPNDAPQITNAFFAKQVEANTFPCILEPTYFMDPRSKINGVLVEDFRQACGERLYVDNANFFEQLKSEHGDNVVVVPILDSGKHGGIGFAQASRIAYKEYFLRRHNAPMGSSRSYIQSTQEMKEHVARMKLDLEDDKIAGKVVIDIDDSIILATSSKINNQRLREAGAALIVQGIVSSRVEDICYLGMNHQKRKKLAAQKFGSNEEIAHHVGADYLFYLSLQSYQDVYRKIFRSSSMCTGCFGGNYPVTIHGKQPTSI